MDHPNLDFYAAAAQVIPVLFLALAFQARTGFFPSILDDLQERIRREKEAGTFLTPSTDDMRDLLESEGYEIPKTPEDEESLFRDLKMKADRSLAQSRLFAAIGTFLGMAALVYGEAAAFGVLQAEAPSEAKEAVVAGSMLIGGSLIFLPIIRDQIVRLEPLHPVFVRRPYSITFGLIGVLLTLALFAYPI